VALEAKHVECSYACESFHNWSSSAFE
jgi:hypothetical protein